MNIKTYIYAAIDGAMICGILYFLRRMDGELTTTTIITVITTYLVILVNQNKVEIQKVKNVALASAAVSLLGISDSIKHGLKEKDKEQL